MTLFQKKPVAISVTVLVVLLSCLLGVGRSVTKLANKTSELFYTGVTGDDYGVDDALSKAVEYAKNLETIASSYEALSQETEALSEALSPLSGETRTAAMYPQYAALQTAVERLYQAADTDQFTQKNAQYFEDYYHNFQDAALKLKRQAASYNDAVDTYEKTVLGKFPVSVLKGIAGIPEVEAFEG